MQRRSLLALPLIATLAALGRAAPAWGQGIALTPRDRDDIDRIQDYLNGLHTLKARFLQIAPNGATSEGTAWLERPGRMRFQYDPPTPLLLVAGHGLFVYYDRELHQTTNIPLGSTPLGLLLRENMVLSGDVTVIALYREPGQIQISVNRTASPGDGNLTLVFADKPLALRQWIVVDAQRQETRVSLFDVQLGGTFDQDMFAFVDPKFAPGGDKYYK
jgi:outer membrane lipoprotein-sorting protein